MKPRPAFDQTEHDRRPVPPLVPGLLDLFAPDLPEPGNHAATSDAAWLLSKLQNGQVWTLTQLLRASFAERSHGLTVHSRVADLRADGYTIEWRKVAGAKRGESSTYQLRPGPL